VDTAPPPRRAGARTAAFPGNLRRKRLHVHCLVLADTIAMNDFHIALLWLRSLEIVIGHSPVLMLSELEMHDLFVRYRSPYKA
jgi:hypothetical protein